MADSLGIAIGSDHRGFRTKQMIVETFKADGYQFHDFGCPDETSVDYPDVAKAVCDAISSGDFNRGILICGSGIGMSIAANKIKRVRAALCSDVVSAHLSREHNDANVLCLGGEILGPWLIKEIVTTFLMSEFAGARHARRLEKMRQLES
jgi:ribose 5-phosphate isomerase B